MNAQRKPESLLPLPPFVAYILFQLTKGNRHAYKLYTELRKQLDPTAALGPTTIYRLIERMQREGLIEETPDRPPEEWDDERRVYFRITDFGQAVLVADVQRQARFVADLYGHETMQPKKESEDTQDQNPIEQQPPGTDILEIEPRKKPQRSTNIIGPMPRSIKTGDSR